ncbi:hypothetical protein [Rhodopila sp.]|uniref:hypothetical protein n=1 Tax=Rhodopila sp. TaxID=2480087 RepID=UPI003D0A84F3
MIENAGLAGMPPSSIRVSRRRRSARTGEADGEVSAETSFLVVRTMRDRQMMIFAAGVYRDRLRPDGSGALRYADRVVVCDSQRFDTLLAIPL